MAGPGQTSYARTAAGEDAWTNFNYATELANAGRFEDAKQKLWAILDNPSASQYLKRLAAELLTKIHSPAIAEAMKSEKPGDRLEGKTAEYLINAGFNIIRFQRKFGPSARNREIDIETECAIVEVTTGKRRLEKEDQLLDLMNLKELNPRAKPVILYAPEYNRSGLNIKKIGIHVIRTPDELFNFLNKNKEQ